MEMDSGSDQDHKTEAAHRSSQLFLLRVWQADTIAQDLQGKIQHTVTGEVRHFASSSELVQLLRRMLHP